MKYLLAIEFDTQEPIMSWDLPSSERDVRNFLNVCLDDIKDARINGFVCQRLDGQDLSGALANCHTVAEGLAVAELLAVPS